MPSHGHLPVLSVLASGVFRFDATALSFATVRWRGARVIRCLADKGLGVESQGLWRLFQVSLAALCPVAGSTLAALVLSRLFHPRRWGALADARHPLKGSETTKVRAQPLPLRPLPVEEDRPHHVSRSVGRLRDWSRGKLHDAPGPVKALLRRLLRPGQRLNHAARDLRGAGREKKKEAPVPWNRRLSLA